MKIHCVVHADFESPSYFETWAKENDFTFTLTETHKGESLPSAHDFDFLLLMGGPQSPLQIEKYPYLNDEIQLVKEAAAQDKTILGVCLGAQLIAESFGAKTQRSPNREIGVFPLTLTAAAKSDPIFKTFPDTFQVAHWHNDMPGIPEGATILAESEGCPRQIIKFSPKIYGFQCHFEFTKKSIDELITSCPKDLVPEKYIQSETKFLSHDLNKINLSLKLFLDKFVALDF